MAESKFKRSNKYSASVRASVMAALANTDNIAEVCRNYGISRATIDRWRKDYAEELRLSRNRVEAKVAQAAAEDDPTAMVCTRLQNGINLGLDHITNPKSWANANIAQSASALGVLLDKLKALNGGKVGRELEIKFEIPEEYKR